MESSIFLEASEKLVSTLTTLYGSWPEGLRQFQGTPERIARMYLEFCWHPDAITAEINKQLKVFDDEFNEMLVVKDLHLWSLCPHHLLPCQFRVFIGYIPAEKKVLGLSKFSRIAEVLAKRPILQERYTTELANLIMDRLTPKGVGVTVYGTHGCMVARGVRQNSEVVTSVMKGDFLKEGPTRSEFLAYCRDKE